MSQVTCGTLFLAVCHLQGHAFICPDDLGAVQASRRGEMICRCAKHNDVDWWALTWQQLHVTEEQGVKGIETHTTKEASIQEDSRSKKYMTNGNDSANELNVFGPDGDGAMMGEYDAKNAHEVSDMENFLKCI